MFPLVPNSVRWTRLQPREDLFNWFERRVWYSITGYYKLVLTFGLFSAEEALANVSRKPIPGVHPPTALNLKALPPHLSPS